MLSAIILFLALCLSSHSLFKIISIILVSAITKKDRDASIPIIVLFISFILWSYLFYLLH